MDIQTLSPKQGDAMRALKTGDIWFPMGTVGFVIGNPLGGHHALSTLQSLVKYHLVRYYQDSSGRHHYTLIFVSANT